MQNQWSPEMRQGVLSTSQLQRKREAQQIRGV